MTVRRSKSARKMLYNNNGTMNMHSRDIHALLENENYVELVGFQRIEPTMFQCLFQHLPFKKVLALKLSRLRIIATKRAR